MKFSLVTAIVSAAIGAVLATSTLGTPSYEVISLHPNYHGKGGIGKSRRYDYRFIPDYRYIRPVGLLSHGFGHATYGHKAANPAVLGHHGLGIGLGHGLGHGIGHHGIGHGIGHHGIGHHGIGHGVGIGHHGLGHGVGIGHHGLGHGVGIGHHGLGHHHGGHIGIPFIGGQGFGIPGGVGNLPFIG